MSFNFKQIRRLSEIWWRVGEGGGGLLFEEYLDFMDNEGGDFENEVGRDRENANIIVDSRCDKGFRNGKFYVNDLMSGLKLAQNKGGVIFLENGDYTTEMRGEARRGLISTFTGPRDL